MKKWFGILSLFVILLSTLEVYAVDSFTSSKDDACIQVDYDTGSDYNFIVELESEPWSIASVEDLSKGINSNDLATYSEFYLCGKNKYNSSIDGVYIDLEKPVGWNASEN